MTLIDIQAQCCRTGNKLYELLKWDRYSSLHKLTILTAVASIAAVFLDHWGPLIGLIASVAAFVKLTGDVMSGRWTFSSNPLIPYLERLDRVREAVTAGTIRTERNSTQEFRTRSESIASPHIPDLEVGLDPTATGSTFNRNVRLELNSIVLLTVRDFVQFWYHSFSYNSQFLKDSRQFLFRGIHNVVERVARLRPHQTSAKLIHAYQVHLSSFQTARGLFRAQSPPALKLDKELQIKLQRPLQRVESVDEAFHSKFHFHRALESEESEKEYLRSVTKTILLCACSKDVISAGSAQIFFIEVLAVNVLMPVVEMLSTPDRLYEILIRLTYSEGDVIVNDKVLKHLIETEKEKVRSEVEADGLDSELPAVTEGTGDHGGAIETVSSQKQTLGQSASAEQTVRNVHVSHGHKDFKETKEKQTKEADSDHLTRRNSMTVKDADDVENSSEEQKSQTEEGSTVKKDVTSAGIHTDETPQVSSQYDSVGVESDRTAADNTESKEEDKDEKLTSSSINGVDAEIRSQGEENHIYGEMTSTGLPTLKPKLQAFKDLFKSKKSKQQEQSRLEGASVDKVTESISLLDGNTNRQSGDVSTSQKLKSLRLSPLLSRSNRLFGSGNQEKLEDAGKDGAGIKKSPSGQECEKQTPSPMLTPSPSQPTKGGPLSFLRFRKSSPDQKKGLASASVSVLESKNGEHASTGKDTAGATSAVVASSDSHLSGAGTLPTVQVTDESGTSASKLNASLQPNTSAPSLRTISISSYDEISVSDYEDNAESSKPLLFIALGEEDEEAEMGEEADVLAGGTEGSVVTHPDSSLIFQDISIPATSTGQEFRSNAQYTLYHIEYEALHFSESGLPVLRTGAVKRRHREFINLMSRLDDKTAYKKLLKDVKGPKRWQTLPFKNMDKESVAGRQRTLEQFLKSLIQVEAVCNGPELREFLAYEGDSHIAFVRKTTEINVPRIDKMLARTMSGVFDKLKSLPSLPQEVMSGIRGRDGSADRKEGEGANDVDSINVLTEFSQEMVNNALRDISEKFVRDEQIQGRTGPKTVHSLLESYAESDVHPDCVQEAVRGSTLTEQILRQVPRVEGDGAESPDNAKEGLAGSHGMGDGSQDQLLLFDPVMRLVLQLLQAQGHWLCRQRVLSAVRNTLGSIIDSWLKGQITSLTTEDRCLYYIRLLRETVWPGGTFFSSEGAEKSAEEKAATRAVAKRLLFEFFPGVTHLLVGPENMEAAAEELLESLQYTKLNKHFIYTTLDSLMEVLFPEMADPEFQKRLLS